MSYLSSFSFPHNSHYALGKDKLSKLSGTCPEAVAIPKEVIDISHAIVIGKMSLLTFISLNIFVRQLLHSGSKNKVSRRDFLKLMISGALTAWSQTSYLRFASLPTSNSSSSLEAKALNRFLYSADAAIGKTNFNNINTFFRDLMMSRRLQRCANYQSENVLSGKSPTINYNVHIGHAGLEAYLDNEWLFFKVLNLFPNILLKNIIDYNGGITAFATSIFLKLDSEDPSKDKFIHYLDQELSEFLIKKLDS